MGIGVISGRREQEKERNGEAQREREDRARRARGEYTTGEEIASAVGGAGISILKFLFG